MKTNTYGALCVLIILSIPLPALAGACDPLAQNSDALPSRILAKNLSLTDALDLVRSASPNVRASALEAQARAAEARQAGRFSNPTFRLEAENFAGSGEFEDFDQSETTLALEQTFEIGGQRHKRKRAAQARAALASADCEVILREAELETAALYFELAAATDLSRLAQESGALADSLVEIVQKRVDAGAAAPPELSRARAEAAALKARAEILRAQVDIQKFALASMWGENDPTFDPPLLSHDVGARDAMGDNVLQTHPLIAQAEAGIQVYEAEQHSQRAQGLPDISVSLGVRRFEGTDEDALVAGVGVPLPLFDQNRDAARAAELRAQASKLEREAVQRELMSNLRASLATVRAARGQLSALEADALPAANSAYSASLRGYEAGRFSLTDTIDARRTLLDVRVSVIEAKQQLYTQDMRLRSLIGTAPFVQKEAP